MSSPTTEAVMDVDHGREAAEPVTLILDATADQNEGSHPPVPPPKSYPKDWSRCRTCAGIYPLGQSHDC